MRTAWVLPGGSAFGAVQAGLASALSERDIAPDLLVGTSAGSLNAAWLAGDPSPAGIARLRDMWSTMRRGDIFPMNPLKIVAGKLGLSNHLMSNRALGDWVRRALPHSTFAETEVPLTVTATDLGNSEVVYFEDGPLLPALVASCALPGVFPPVQVNGRWLIDGGATAYIPISRAVELGAERVYVLPCTGDAPLTDDGAGTRGPSPVATLPSPKEPPKSISGVNGAALSAAMVSAAALDMQLNAARCELYVLPAPDTSSLSPYSFEHSPKLIQRAWTLAQNWLPEAQPVPPNEVVDITGRPRPHSTPKPESHH